MMKLSPVDRLSVQITALITAEEKAMQEIEEIRRERARLNVELHAAVSGSRAKSKAERKTRQPRRKPKETGAHEAPPVTAPSKESDEQASEKVKAYVLAHGAGEITPNAVSQVTGVRSGLCSTYLSRMNGTLVERVPGTKRGRYQRIRIAS